MGPQPRDDKGRFKKSRSVRKAIFDPDSDGNPEVTIIDRSGGPIKGIAFAVLVLLMTDILFHNGQVITSIIGAILG